VIDHFIHLTGVKREDICRKSKNLIERAMLMELLYRFSRISQPEIGRIMGGIEYSSVSQARKRLQGKLEREPKLKRRFDELRDQFLDLSNAKR